jgi:hypothetical protein
MQIDLDLLFTWRAIVKKYKKMMLFFMKISGLYFIIKS